MEVTFGILLFVYLIFLALVRWWWSRIPEQHVSNIVDDLPGVSLVIPARNEQHNIDRLITSINQVDYPKQKLEIVVVDDSSEDDTLAKLEQLASQQSNLVCLSWSESENFQGSYKKRALTRGIEAAKFPIIVTTDADCQFNPIWIKALVAAIQTNQWKMACGPVVYADDGFLSPLLNIELACLVAVGAVSLHLGYPNMCNGANLAVSRQAFFDIGGYQGFEQVVSGDDEFLLHKMCIRYPGQAGFLKNKEALVITDAPESWKALLDQRKRWGSKWTAHKSVSTRLLALLIFCFHLLFTLVMVMTIFGFYSWKVFLGQLLAKMLLEILLIVPVLTLMGKRLVLKWFFLMQMVYSFYVVFVGLTAQFGSFKWKNRQY